MLERLELRDVGPSPSMRLDLAPRLNVFAGDNGVGKTLVLDVAWWALTGLWVSYPASPRRGTGTSPAISYNIDHGGVPNATTVTFDFPTQQWHGAPAISSSIRALHLVFYMRVDGGVAVYDPFRFSGRVRFPLDPLTLAGQSSAFEFSQSEIWEGLVAEDHESTVLCNGLIRD